MKIGTLTLFLIKRYLKSHDKLLHRNWPDEIYQNAKNVDALGDGRYDHQFSIAYAPAEKRLGHTLIDVHGGSYVYSYRDNNLGFADFFVQRGYDVVLLDYPHNNKKQGCDEQIRVLAAQLKYLSEHREELGLGKGKIGLIGDSAGGHLALLLALANCDKKVAELLNVDMGDIKFNGIAVSSPVFDFVKAASEPMLTKGAKKTMFGPKYADPEEIERLSPKTYIGSMRIPVYLNTCRHDFIGEHSYMLLQEMERLGIKYVFRNVDSEDRNVDHVHNVIKTDLEESKMVNAEIADFFDALFREK